MNTIETILSPVRQELSKIESELIKNLDLDIPLLKEILEYILSISGKRLRPAIHFLTARCFGYTGDAVYLIGSLIEYVHTATLLHDDVIDNADFRRSKKSPRTIWGNEASVLAGDFLFTESFRKLSTLNNIQLVCMMSEATTNMAKGEIIQLMNVFDNTSEADYLKIIEYKTASLLALSSKMGACIAGASAADILTMERFGINFGNAFQILDDLMDYAPASDDTGKKKGIDLKERKITLPLCRLIHTANRNDKRKITTLLNKDLITDDDFESISALLLQYDCMDYCLNKAAHYSDIAMDALNNLPNNAYSKSLKELVAFCMTRKS